MFCHKCGNELLSEALFCNKCGIRQVSDSNIGERPPSDKVTIHLADSGQLAPAQFENEAQFTPAQRSDPLTPPPSSAHWSVTPAPPSSWQTSTLVQPQPATPTYLTFSPSVMQRWMIQLFQPALASNALFGVVLGALVAVISGIVMIALILAIAHAIAAHINYTGYATSEVGIDYILGFFPLDSFFRDSLLLFFVAHGAAIHIQYGSASGSYTSMFSLTRPLHGLLILPALGLMLGGYIAASSDFRNTARSSLGRGAAIAIPYIVLLFILTSQVNGCLPDSSQSGAASFCVGSSSSTLSIDGFSLFIFGVLWSILFGLLGASLKLARGQWRHMLLSFLWTTTRPRVTGMITGALVATGLGISLALLSLYSLLAYNTLSVPLLAQNLCYPGNWLALTVWGFAQGPLHAVNFFFFSLGAPITISASQPGQCFYASGSHTVLSLLGNNPQLPPWIYSVLALPVISLFIGGRVSAALGRAQGIGPGAVQGALIAVPFAILMMLLTVICTVTVTSASNGTGNSLTSSIQSAGVGAFDVLLWALLSGAVFGALGGMYQTGSVKTEMSRLLSLLAVPLKVLTEVEYQLLDRLSGQNRSFGRRSRVRVLLYNALLCTLLLLLVAGVVGAILIIYNQLLTFQDNQRIRDIMSVVLVVLPGLFLLGACASALTTDPSLEHQSIPRA